MNINLKANIQALLKLLQNGNKGTQPFQKINEKMPDIESIMLYSAKKNMAKNIAPYSTLNPATSSPSASPKSKGALLVSIKADIKKITAKGQNK